MKQLSIIIIRRKKDREVILRTILTSTVSMYSSSDSCRVRGGGEALWMGDEAPLTDGEPEIKSDIDRDVRTLRCYNVRVLER